MSQMRGVMLVIVFLLGLMAGCAPSAPASPTAAPAKPPAAPTQPAQQVAPVASGKPEAPVAAKPAAAGAPGYTFIASHDEIVQKARQEGKLKILASAVPASIEAIKKDWASRYPGIELIMEELTGTDAAQRFALELQAGVSDWDVIPISTELYDETIGHTEKVDLLSMAEQGVLKIDPRMIAPDLRNVAAYGNQVGVIVYNKNLVPPGMVPTTWEDLLKPEWKGRKLLVETRPNTHAALAPAKGEDWVKDFSVKLAAQSPIWARGPTRSLTGMQAGEYALHAGAYYAGTQRAIERGASNLAFVVPEPVSVTMTVTYSIRQGTRNLNAALLFMEYMALPDGGQKILDDVEPLKSSIYSPGSKVAELVRGKQLSLADWSWFKRQGDIEEMIITQYGFPRAEVQ